MATKWPTREESIEGVAVGVDALDKGVIHLEQDNTWFYISQNSNNWKSNEGVYFWNFPLISWDIDQPQIAKVTETKISNKGEGGVSFAYKALVKVESNKCTASTQSTMYSQGVGLKINENVCL